MTAGFGASELRRAVLASLQALRAHREEIDRANVYPVPDGDTGTNMALTMEAAARALEGLPDDPDAVAGAVARGSLLGARGNSGVILAQILRGFCERVRDGSGTAVAQGLLAGARLAYEAVLEPVEGTILTVAREAAEAARSASTDAAAALEAAAEAASRALARTPDLLPVLRNAGVVDAGGWGLTVVLQAFRDALTGAAQPVGVGDRIEVRPDQAAAEHFLTTDPELGWEVQYLLEAGEPAIPQLRRSLGAVGDSVAVIGGGGLWRVHVHTRDVEAAVRLGERAGAPWGVSVVPLLDARAAECTAEGYSAVVRRDAAAAHPSGGIPLADTPNRAALVAVAVGDGARTLFTALGAAVVVDGGRTMNPSVGEFLDAIERAPSERVILLTNNEDAVAAARRAAAESGKRVEIVGAPDMAAGTAAALAFGDARPMEDNLRDMREALGRTRSGTVAPASRDVATPAGTARAGQFLGMAAGAPAVVEDDPAEACVALAAVLAEGAEVLTVLAGAEATVEERARAAARLAERLPGVEVEMRDGGQPVYRYLLAAE